MNSENFTNLLQNPKTIDGFKTQQLEDVIIEFPYFQAARALQLKGLKKINSYKYNQALKKTAAHTIDRKVLFNFITSPKFLKTSTKEIEILEEIEVVEAETLNVLHKKITDSFSLEPTQPKPVTLQKKEIEIIEEIIEPSQKQDHLLEIGKPLQFNSSEPHSFNEWMQLISKKPIKRASEVERISKKTNKIEDKFSLINKFIELKPKIKPVDKQAINIDISEESSYENESLMTETLAKVYLEQKKYENAIKAYRILSLKYPEKSSFFANRIKAIKILQKNKS